MDPGAVLLGAARVGRTSSSRHAVFDQYDSTVGADTVAGPGPRRRGPAGQGHDARRSSPRPTATRPSARSTRGSGAALSVAEATRNVSITGARPLGVTNCLNYGDPTRPEAFWQLTEGVRGLGRRLPGARPAGHRRQRLALQRVARRARSRRRPRSASSACSTTSRTLVGPAFAPAHDAILLVGEATPGPGRHRPTRRSPGAAPEDGPPALDLAREARLQAFVREAIARGLVASAQDVSGGGLAVALAECAMWGGLGAAVRLAGRRTRRRSTCSARARRGSS